MLDFKELGALKTFNVPCQHLRIKSETHMEIAGKTVVVEPHAFDDLLKIAGVTKKVVDNVSDTIGDQGGLHLVSSLIKALSQKSGLILRAVVNTDSLRVVRFTTAADGTQISAETFASMVEMLSETSGINMRDVKVLDSGTKAAVTFYWDKDIPLAMKGENISSGKQVTWDMFGDVKIVDYVERLKCTNGMTNFLPASLVGEGGGMKKLTAESSPSEWYQKIISDLKNPDPKKIAEYEKLVFEARQTNLSVAEYNKIKGHALEYFAQDGPIITRYLGDERWKADYTNKGLDIENMPSGQLVNCPTPVNKWDGINLLTDLASHDYATRVGKGAKMATQALAGKLLKKAADENGQVLNPPKFDRSKPIS